MIGPRHRCSISAIKPRASVAEPSMWPRSPTLRSGRRTIAQNILADRPSRHLGRLIDKPSYDRALHVSGVDHWTLGVIVTRQRIDSIDFKLILSSVNWAEFDHGRGKVGIDAEQPMYPTPICRQLPVFRHCCRGGATAGSGGKRESRGVADKLVGQPRDSADAREAENAGEGVHRVAARLGDSKGGCVESRRSPGHSSAVMHRVYPTANKT
jgi:hypothetical protein